MDFDPNAYLDSSTTEASVRRPPVPAGDYPAVITNLEAGKWQSKDKTDPKTGELLSGPKFNFSLDVELPPAVQELCGIKQLKLSDGVLIDVTEDKAIDYSPGKNSRLRMYREATNLNNPGEPFSPRMLIGKPIKLRVVHEEWQGQPQERAGAIAKLG